MGNAEEEACCGNGICDGAEMGFSCPQDCSPDDLSLTKTQIGEASNGYKSRGMLRWRPLRGTEGKTLLLCVAVRAVTQGDFASTIQERNANNAPSLCFVTTIERCSFCLEYRSTLKTVADSLLFNQHWLRLYNSNPAILNPDSIQASQRFVIGPLYNVTSGDTILSIAAMAKTTVKAILVNNPDVTRAEALQPNAPLCLPLCSSPPIGLLSK